MRESKQEASAKTKSQQLQDSGEMQLERVEAEEMFSSQHDPLVGISGMGNAPSVSSHAAMLNRFPGAGQSSHQQFLLQLQQQYGNRYVNQVVQMARRGEALQSATSLEQHESMKGEAEAGGEGIGMFEVREENKTGLPDNLKAGIEALSGISMDDVKVHYNSSKPSQLQALAYTQGTDIYVGSGQEKHLPHEAWHVVQQAQGRVSPSKQSNDGLPVNVDKCLEHEADVMGERAVQTMAGRHAERHDPVAALQVQRNGLKSILDSPRSAVVQARFYEWNPDGETTEEKYIWHWGPVINALWEKKLEEGSQEQEMWRGYGVWVRKGTSAHLKQVFQNLTPPQLQDKYNEIIEVKEEVIQIIDERTGLLTALNEKMKDSDSVQSELVKIKEIVETYQQELGKALKKYATISIITIGLSAGVSAIAMYYLSLPAIPWELKAAIDIAGILYGAYIAHRWMTTDLLPVLVRAILVVGNSANWASVIYMMIAEALQGHAFQSVHIAALPFAITIEILLRRIMSKVEAKMLEKRKQQV